MPTKNKKLQARLSNESYYRNREKIILKNNLRKIQYKESIAALKRDIPCKDCGNSYDPVAMDFDHVRGEKFMDIAKMTVRGFPLEKIKKEIEKCDLVCAVCHRIRTSQRHNARPLEGIESHKLDISVRF